MLWRVLRCESQKFHIWGKKVVAFETVAHIYGIIKEGKDYFWEKNISGEFVGRTNGNWILSKNYEYCWMSKRYLWHDCMNAAWKVDHKIDFDMWARTRAKWFPAHSGCHFFFLSFFFAVTPHERRTICSSMHPAFGSRFMWLYENQHWLPSVIVFYQAVWVIQCMHFGRISNHNNVFWGRDLSLHVYELWAVKQQTLRPGLHYRTQCPLCVRNSQPLNNFRSVVTSVRITQLYSIVTEWLERWFSFSDTTTVIYEIHPTDFFLVLSFLFKEKKNIKTTHWVSMPSIYITQELRTWHKMYQLKCWQYDRVYNSY